MKEEIIYLEMSDSSNIVVEVTNFGNRYPKIWNFCAKRNCKNRTYHNSIFCYPHTKGDMIEKAIEKAKKKLPAHELQPS